MKNIIITGGELFNKGAQAMTFIAVDEMKKRFPDHQIIVLSEMDLQRPKEEREQYAFKFMGWYPLKFARCQNNPLLKVMCLLRNKKEFTEAEEIYKNTDIMIDISGYALGSNWGIETCNHYLDHLEFAKAFQIPVYLMPQSFGPFDFSDAVGREVDRRIAELLPTAKVLCAREREGYLALKEHYHLENVLLTNDLVVNNRGVNLDNIFRKKMQTEILDIENKSVAVIPNQRNFAVSDAEEVQTIYLCIIQKLLQNGFKVYLISHSDMDMEICKKLKEAVPEDDDVLLIDQQLNCIEFNEVVKQFHFVVASRFHALVHAFKNKVPCIALGWATKYHDLMKQFGQEQYMLDVRQSISNEMLDTMIYSMIRNRKNNTQIIYRKLEELQETDIFDIIKL